MLIIQSLQFYYFFFVIALAYPLFFQHKTGLLISWVWAVVLVQATYHAIPAPNIVDNAIYLKLSGKDLYLQTQALQYLALCYILPLLCLTSKTTKSLIMYGIFLFCTVNAGYVIYQVLIGESKGLIEASTFDLALGCTYVALFYKYEQISTIEKAALYFILLAAFFIGSTTTYTVVGTGVFAIALLKIRDSKLDADLKYAATTLSVTAFAGLAMVASYLYVRFKDYEGSRLHIWDNALAYFKVTPWGHGVGSFQWYALHNPVTEGQRYLLAHNDYVQAFIELGVYPCLALLIALAVTLYRYYRTPGAEVLFITLCSYCVLAVSYYPLHYPLSLIMGLVIIADGFQYPKILRDLRALEWLKKS